MNLLKRKTPHSIRRGDLPDPNAKVFMRIKLAVMLLFCGLGFYLYVNWQTVLEKLDDKPISAFALIGIGAPLLSRLAQ